MDIKNKIKKLLGHKFDTRYTWGELTIRKFTLRSLTNCVWLGIKCIHDQKNGGKFLSIHIPFVDLYIHLNKKEVDLMGYDSKIKEYGIEFYERTELCFYFGYWNERIYMPWMSEWQSTEYLTTDLQTVVFKETRKNKFEDFSMKMKIQDFLSSKEPYKYVRKSGEVQERTASYFVERRTWGWKSLPFIKKKSTSIWVTLNKEIGERVDSWKGGCTGCGYEIKEGETALECLKRMERERKFD